MSITSRAEVIIQAVSPLLIAAVEGAIAAEPSEMSSLANAKVEAEDSARVIGSENLLFTVSISQID